MAPCNVEHAGLLRELVEYFTDDDVQFLGANFSEEHAKAARWFSEGMPGLGRDTPSGDPQADTERAMRAVRRAGSEATGMRPEEYETTIVDAMFIISVRREAAERHVPQFFDDAMRWRNASDAEKRRIQEEITAKYRS
jgi:hypothetical protein